MGIGTRREVVNFAANLFAVYWSFLVLKEFRFPDFVWFNGRRKISAICTLLRKSDHEKKQDPEDMHVN